MLKIMSLNRRVYSVPEESDQGNLMPSARLRIVNATCDAVLAVDTHRNKAHFQLTQHEAAMLDEFCRRVEQRIANQLMDVNYGMDAVVDTRETDQLLKDGREHPLSDRDREQLTKKTTDALRKSEDNELYMTLKPLEESAAPSFARDELFTPQPESAAPAQTPVLDRWLETAQAPAEAAKSPESEASQPESGQTAAAGA